MVNQVTTTERKPFLAVSVARILKSPRWVLEPYQPNTPWKKRWRYQGAVSPGDVQEAIHGVQAIEEYLKPCSELWLRGAIQTMLLHYYTSALPEWQYRAIAEDWVVHLIDFPEWAVKLARFEWMKKNNPRPKIHNIRDICKGLCQKYIETRVKLKSIIEMGEKPDDRTL